ncbi:MAG: FGGY-family carbohydrate kinase [Candidatus Helarchaeota archaeon]
MPNYIIALDFGTGTGRCLIFSTSGELIIHTSEEWKYNESWIPFGDNKVPLLDFNAEKFWRILCKLTAQAIKQSKIDPDDILAISSTSMRQGCVFLDKNGKELYAGPNMDARAFKEGMEIQGKYKDKIQYITGHLPPIIYIPAKLAWFKNNKIDIYKKIDKFLMINDWIIYKLTGEYISEPSNTSESLLLDVHSISWSKELMDLLNVPEHILPELQNSGFLVTDEIESHIAKNMGIPSNIKVITGGADTQCALLGTKTVNPGQTCAVAGTSTPVQIVTSKPSIDEKCRIWTGCHVIPNMWIIDSDAGETGHNLRWLKKVLNIDFQEIDRLAEIAAPGSSGFIANLGGSKANYGNLSGLGYGGFLIPLPIVATEIYRAEFCRGLLENLAYVIKLNAQQVEEVSRLKVGEDDFSLTGGQANSNLFAEIVSNVLGFPIKVFKIKEGSALGCAVLASIGAGIYKNFDEATQNMVHLEKKVDPNKELTKTYRKLFRKWNKMYINFQKLK